MFEGADFPKPLDEAAFNSWLENGRNNKIAYRYMLVIWDRYDLEYKPAYAANRPEIDEYDSYRTSTGRESIVAAYDLFSESRISLR